MSIDARALLSQAIEAGLQFGDVISAFHAQQAPVSSAVARYASEDFSEEGVCEIESTAFVSKSANGGHYVSAWVWVPDTSLPPPLRLWQEASRQADLDIELPGTGDMLSLEGSTFALNDEAWDKLLGGTPVEDSAWLLKSATAGDAFVLYMNYRPPSACGAMVAVSRAPARPRGSSCPVSFASSCSCSQA